MKPPQGQAKMKIIDFHTHFFPDTLADHAVNSVVEICNGEIQSHLDGRLSSLKVGMDSAGISQSITLPVATRPEHTASINPNLPLNDDRIIPFGALHPDADFESDLDFLLSKGVKGVKLHPEYQGFYITDEKYKPFFDALSQSNLIVLFHAGYDPGPFSRDHCTPADFKVLLSNFPKLNIVAAHLGGLAMWNDVEEHLVGKDLFLDTAAISSFISKEQFVRIARNHGVEKILFGSDSPWCSQQESIDFIIESGLKDFEIEIILSKNATALLEI
jgi:predicted TIM-barrel fold metal-dependent hydrolase